MAIAEIAEVTTEASEPRLAVKIGAKLRRARQAQGRSLKEVAGVCNTTPQTIQRLEMGTMTMSLDWLELLCSALEVKPIELFYQADLEATVAKMRRMRTNATALHAHLEEALEHLNDFLERTK